MLNKYLINIVSFILAGTLCAQKKQIDHTVYNDWKSLKAEQISSKGNFSTYEINPHAGDGYLYIVNNNDLKIDSFPRGNRASINYSEDILVFHVHPGYDTIRELQLKKVKKEKMVNDSLGIYYLKSKNLVKIPNLISYKIADQGSYVAYSVLSDSLQKEKTTKKKFRLFKKKNKVSEVKSNGNHLYILDPITGNTMVLEKVTDYAFNKNGTKLFYVTHQNVSKKDSFKVHIYDLTRNQEIHFDSNFTAVTQQNFSEKGGKLMFLASNDTVKEKKCFDLYFWDLKDNSPVLIADTNRSDMPEKLRVSANNKPYFSLDETKIYFGLEEIPLPPSKDTLLESEKAKLDVWHYKDKRLQPQQLIELKRDQKKSFLSVIHLDQNKLVRLSNDTLEIDLLDHGNTDYALGMSNERYQETYNWSFPWPKDYYKVNLQTGEAFLIKDKVGYSMGLSPDGRYFVYFEPERKQYRFVNTLTAEDDCISCFLKDSIVWQRDINGMPHEAGAFNIAGYTKGKKSLLLHSEFDVWEYDFGGRKLTSLTKQRGEQMNTELRLSRWNYDSTYIDLKEIYLTGYNRDTKNESIFGYQDHVNHSHIVQLMETPHKILSVQKAREGSKVIYRKMNVKDYPDLFLTNMNFDEEQRISITNPQQDEYIWPTVEKITWTSYSGKELEGLLYKPDNFDSTKSYPMLVYFYELYNDRYNYHYIPKPTASIIYPTEYTSAGYIVFIPDIRYDEGYPAKGAFDCIMSGTDEVLQKYPNIDSTRMGLQGQSWGGYQTAQMITMTNRYKAAMAGAPVSNMFSAYGGIRWGSGFNRQFQYEKTQSRIGKTIWEAPELYRENSPLFGIPNIETPLLIMHNDGDGAVPWYQGIEMFVGMKRLSKPVWMLNYNDDEHNLMKNANRMDLSIRMRQFFDYYLMNKPAPKWLIEGVPAVDKGTDYGLGQFKEE
ncbi:MAG: prolyl oligopeptidase family serine peptidase [Brumimicrobium sp.]|nr:prolyl oligopeptidase family serine peptidase [Brumimicrobium sp.]